MNQWAGEIELDVKNKGGKTVQSSIYYHGALRLMRPFYLDSGDQAYYTILNPGGGYLDGDRYKMKISLQKNAALFLTTQSATKIYKTPSKPVCQENHFYLAEGSVLHYFPDPVIAYRGAQFDQKNIIEMTSGSTLFFSDIITPGWSVDGQNFSYKKIRMRTELYLDRQLVALDHLRLVPDEQNMAHLGFMEDYTHLGTLLIICPEADPFSESLTDFIQNTEAAHSCKIGISCLEASGLIMRILANETQKIEQLFYFSLKYINNLQNRTTVALRKY